MAERYVQHSLLEESQQDQQQAHIQDVRYKNQSSKLLITGNGFLGHHLSLFFAPKYEITITNFESTAAPTSRNCITQVPLDIRDHKMVMDTMEQSRPDIVIHTAADKNVRRCEAFPGEAFETNSLGTRNIARACRAVGARMVYISTDLVFSCDTGGYRETDNPEPRLVYGKTKLQGEYFARDALEDVVICRTGGLYGRHAPLMRWLTTELESGRRLEAFTDVFNTPTYVDNFAEMIDRILQMNLCGVFHTTGPQRANRFEFFRCFAQEFGFDSTLVAPVEGGNRRAELLLQPDASLESAHSRARLGIPFDSISVGLARLKASGDF